MAGSPEAGVGTGGVGDNGRPRTAHGRVVSASGAAAATIDPEDGVSIRAGALLTVESGGGCRASGDGDNSDGQTVLQVGERLQEAVRLCITVVGGGVSRGGEGARPGVPCALTLTEEELSRPRRLLEDLRRLSSRSDGAGAARREAHEGAGGDDEGEAEVGNRKGTVAVVMAAAGAVAALAGTDKPGVVLGHALADAGAQRRRGDEGGSGDSGAAMLIGDPLMMETAWLGDRIAKATLGDLLASRLELSLWASFRRRGRMAGPSGWVKDSIVCCCCCCCCCCYVCCRCCCRCYCSGWCCCCYCSCWCYCCRYCCCYCCYVCCCCCYCCGIGSFGVRELVYLLLDTVAVKSAVGGSVQRSGHQTPPFAPERPAGCCKYLVTFALLE